MVRLPKLGDPLARRLSAVLLITAAGLTIWMFYLGSILHGQAQVRNWSSTWVGLDLMEIAGLFATAILLLRRSVYLSPVAAFTATLFVLDAWFDVMTGGSRFDLASSLAEAFLAELPLAIVLATIAVCAARRSRHSTRV
jgi:hypothetical protein